MTNRGTLCIDCRMINHSGIGTYIRNLIGFMIERYDTILLGDQNDLSSFKAKEVISLKSKIYSIAEQVELFRKVPLCDLFWSPHYNIPIMGIKCKKRVTTIHDVYHLAFYKSLSIKQKIYAKVVINAAVKLSDKVITVSDFSKNEIIKYLGCAPQKIQVVYNGVAQSVSVPGENTVVIKYNLPVNYILFVGNVKPHKNLKTLLKAYLLLSDELKLAYKIVVVGKRDGFLTGDEDVTHWVNEREDLKQHIVFTGYVDNNDMNGLYKNASLFVFPSIYEGFGLPPLEAMLNCCPVIASGTTSIPEVCGGAALYFNPESENELYQKMMEVLTQKKISEKLVAAGLQQIKLFNWDDCAAKHMEIFNRLIEN